MFGIGFFKGQPTDYIIHFRAGRAVESGPGLAFFYLRYRSQIVAVPTQSLDVSFVFNEVSRDYQDVHHDQVLAAARGSKDIFMNILTTNGLVGRYVTDWSGPRSRLSEINIRLGAPNHPDCTMTFTGAVTGKGPLADDEQSGTVTVSIRGSNDLGDHVTGTVLVVLPVTEAR